MTNSQFSLRRLLAIVLLVLLAVGIFQRPLRLVAEAVVAIDFSRHASLAAHAFCWAFWLDLWLFNLESFYPWEMELTEHERASGMVGSLISGIGIAVGGFVLAATHYCLTRWVVRGMFWMLSKTAVTDVEVSEPEPAAADWSI